MMILLVVLAIAPAANASSVQAYRWQLIFAINKTRHVHGLAAVRHAPGLDKTAQSHSADIPKCPDIRMDNIIGAARRLESAAR